MANVPNRLGPTTFAEVQEFARTISESAFCPNEYKRKPGDIIVAIQLGAEIGLAPLQALQNIAVINGKPSIYGDAMIALVKASGLLKDYSETYDEKTKTAICTSVRKDNGNKAVNRFSEVNARRANLWGKQGPWTQYPERMLQMRARGFNLRDNFPDVLKGLISREEAADYPTEVNATPVASAAIEEHRAADVVIVPEDNDLCPHMSNPDECTICKVNTVAALPTPAAEDESQEGGESKELTEASATRAASASASSPKAAGGPQTLTLEQQDTIYELMEQKGVEPDKLTTILKTQFAVDGLHLVPRNHLEALKRRINAEAKRVSA